MKRVARTALNWLKSARQPTHNKHCPAIHPDPSPTPLPPSTANATGASSKQGLYDNFKRERGGERGGTFASSAYLEDPRQEEQFWVTIKEGLVKEQMGNISGHGRCSKAVDDPLITSPRIRLSDGRYLAYRETGVHKDEADYKIIISHGFGSSKEMSFMAPKDLIERFKIHILLYDRAGYGESDPNPKRSVRSESQDIEELADQLQLGPKFYVIGVSMGSYPIWSCLHYIPHRLLGVAFIAPVVNYRWPSLPNYLTKEDFRKNMVKLALWLLKHVPGLLYWWMTQKLFPSASVMEKNPVFFNDRDQEVLKTTPGFELLSENKLEQKSVFENLRRDFMVGFGKWEFDPLKLESPFPKMESYVHLWAGYEDRVVPIELQRHVSGNLPWMKLHEVPYGGHLIVYDTNVCESILRSLVLNEETAFYASSSSMVAVS